MTGVRAAIDAHLGTRQVARVIYGAIIGMALIVVLADHPARGRHRRVAARRDSRAIGADLIGFKALVH